MDDPATNPSISRDSVPATYLVALHSGVTSEITLPLVTAMVLPEPT